MSDEHPRLKSKTENTPARLCVYTEFLKEDLFLYKSLQSKRLKNKNYLGIMARFTCRWT